MFKLEKLIQSIKEMKQIRAGKLKPARVTSEKEIREWMDKNPDRLKRAPKKSKAATNAPKKAKDIKLSEISRKMKLEGRSNKFIVAAAQTASDFEGVYDLMSIRPAIPLPA